MPGTPTTLVARYRDVTPAPPAPRAPRPPDHAGPDRAGPTFGFNSGATGLHTRRSRLRGVVADPSGVKRMRVAVGRKYRNGLCAWWSTKCKRLSAPDPALRPAGLDRRDARATPQRRSTTGAFASSGGCPLATIALLCRPRTCSGMRAQSGWATVLDSGSGEPSAEERPRSRWVLHFLASVMMVSGVLLIADAGVTLAWQEPISAFQTEREQAELESDFESPTRPRSEAQAAAGRLDRQDRAAHARPLLLNRRGHQGRGPAQGPRALRRHAAAR